MQWVRPSQLRQKAWAGSWAGSALSYWIAWKLGRPIFEKYGKYVHLSHAKLAKADDWFAAYGAGGIFVARFLPGVRHVISIPAGLFHMNFARFSLMTILGAGIFNAALTWFGLRVLGVGDESAVEAAASTLDVGQKRGQHPAGAAFCRRDGQPGITQAVHQPFGLLVQMIRKRRLERFAQPRSPGRGGGAGAEAGGSTRSAAV